MNLPESRYHQPELPFQRHSDASFAAARSLELAAPTLRGKVYAALCARSDGMIDEELQAALGMNPSTQRPRRIELVEMGLVVDSGETRKTASGRAATVWKVR